MKPFTDASFLVSFFAKDDHTPRAHQWWSNGHPVMRTSRLAYFEAENSIRSMRVAGKITVEEEFNAIESMKRFVLEGFIELWEVPVKRMFPAARRLSQFHTTNISYGAMDIIHVASALDMDSVAFLSFDRCQRQLATAESMKAQPA